MKIILEQTADVETEIVIRGDLASAKVLDLIKAIQKLQDTEKISKLFLQQDDREYVEDVSHISYFETQEGHTFAHVEERTFETKYKLYELAGLLADKGFVQISKGVVVNVNAIRSVEAEFSGNYLAILKDERTRLSISRKYMKEFRQFVMALS